MVFLLEQFLRYETKKTPLPPKEVFLLSTQRQMSVPQVRGFPSDPSIWPP